MVFDRIKIRKYKNGVVKIFLDDQELENVGSYELIEKRDIKGGESSIKIEFIDLKEVIIEDEKKGY